MFQTNLKNSHVNQNKKVFGARFINTLAQSSAMFRRHK